MYFRIVHVSLQGQNGAPVAAYREQTVEIALGPKGAFENGNVGTLTRRVRADRVVSAVPPRRGKPKPPRKPQPPRVVETLRKAIEWRRQLDAGEVVSQAAIARREGISRARVTQIMALLRLAPDIQQSILSLPGGPNPPTLSELTLRPITYLQDPQKQTAAFEEVIGHRS